MEPLSPSPYTSYLPGEGSEVDMHPSETQQLLGKISPSMCFAKWQQILLNLHVGTSASCCLTPMRPLPEGVEEHTDLFHSGPLQLEERALLWKGERPASCAACWEPEGRGLVSDRLIRSGAKWAHEPAATLDATNYLDPSHPPSYLEVGFSSLCQLSCGYCSSEISSGVEKEVARWGVAPDRTGHHLRSRGTRVYRDDEENPRITGFFKWLPRIYKGLHVLRLTGGEPLLSRHSATLFSWIKENPNPSMDLQINSNLAMPEKALAAMGEKLKAIPRSHYRELWIITSLDGWGPASESMRHGLSLERWERNLRWIRAAFPEAKIRITTTVNAFSLHETRALLAKTREFKRDAASDDQLMLTAYPLVTPAFMSLRGCPPSWREEAQAVLRDMEQGGFVRVEMSFMEKALAPLLTIEDGTEERELRLELALYLIECQRRGRLDLSRTPALAAFMEGERTRLNAEMALPLTGVPSREALFRLLRAWPYLGDEASRTAAASIRSLLATADTPEVAHAVAHPFLFPPRYHHLRETMLSWMGGTHSPAWAMWLAHWDWDATLVHFEQMEGLSVERWAELWLWMTRGHQLSDDECRRLFTSPSLRLRACALASAVLGPSGADAWAEEAQGLGREVVVETLFVLTLSGAPKTTIKTVKAWLSPQPS